MWELQKCNIVAKTAISCWPKARVSWKSNARAAKRSTNLVL
nr:MAG TPA: hypothetical protein [Caudoviricetes sp.]